MKNPDKVAPSRVVIATTAMLSFISFWRAAAIVLNDLGSSAFCVGGIAEHAIGKSAPWFILGVMLFSIFVRSIYIESATMFVRGGVYRVVKEAMGPTMAKISVAALIFDFILTAPISGVSAGQYLVGLVNESSRRGGFPLDIPRDAGSAVFAVLVILYFWRLNLIGIEESSSKAMSIMKATTVMVVVLIGWGLATVFIRGGHMPPPPTPENLAFSDEALGWLKGTMLPYRGDGDGGSQGLPGGNRRPPTRAGPSVAKSPALTTGAPRHTMWSDSWAEPAKMQRVTRPRRYRRTRTPLSRWCWTEA